MMKAFKKIVLKSNFNPKASKVPTYQEMWKNMNSWGSDIFVKNNQEGVQKVRFEY